jgi:hypothetical protein
MLYDSRRRSGLLRSNGRKKGGRNWGNRNFPDISVGRPEENAGKPCRGGLDGPTLRLDEASAWISFSFLFSNFPLECEQTSLSYPDNHKKKKKKKRETMPTHLGDFPKPSGDLALSGNSYFRVGGPPIYHSVFFGFHFQSYHSYISLNYSFQENHTTEPVHRSQDDPLEANPSPDRGPILLTRVVSVLYFLLRAAHVTPILAGKSISRNYARIHEGLN